MVRCRRSAPPGRVLELVELRSSNPIENVLTGRLDARAIKADHDARVDAPGQEGAERHVRHHVRFDRIGEHALERMRGFVGGAAKRFGSGNDAASTGGPRVGRPCRSGMGGGQLLDPLKIARLRGRVRKRQIVVERLGIDLAIAQHRPQSATDLGAEV